MGNQNYMKNSNFLLFGKVTPLFFQLSGKMSGRIYSSRPCTDKISTSCMVNSAYQKLLVHMHYAWRIEQNKIAFGIRHQAYGMRKSSPKRSVTVNHLTTSFISKY